MRNEAYLLLGTNLGDRDEHLRWAVEQIASQIGPVLMCSSIYTTEPWNMDDSPWFLNQVVKIETKLSAADLLRHSKAIESQRGRKAPRQAPERYLSRILDIDLLYMNRDVIEEERLIVPHPRLHLRRFTLLPLCEIAPDFIHPVLKQDHNALLSDCPDTSQVNLHR